MGKKSLSEGVDVVTKQRYIRAIELPQSKHGTHSAVLDAHLAFARRGLEITLSATTLSFSLAVGCAAVILDAKTTGSIDIGLLIGSGLLEATTRRSALVICAKKLERWYICKGG